MAQRGFLTLVGTDTESGPELSAAFGESFAAPWLRACKVLREAGYGPDVPAAYERWSPVLAGEVGPAEAIDLCATVSAVTIKAGRRAGALLPQAAAGAAIRLGSADAYRSWLGLMHRFAGLAPESTADVLARMERLLGELSVARLEAWLLAGLRSSGSDRERRLAFFRFEDPDAERWLGREAGEIAFSDVERRLRAWMTAMWGLRPIIREPSPTAPDWQRRRPGFAGGVIRMPATMPGYRGGQAVDIFRAALAHIGAHLAYGGPRLPVGSLKPVQIAIVSLIEDARVEHLAMREFPGLARLWLPFHIAQATGVLTAPSLFARLSRALIDPTFTDADGWIRKARERFFALEHRWTDPTLAREIGNLLGNDLGQMRVQFNARTYVVEPPYRDDNMGLWDFGDAEPSTADEMEVAIDTARPERQEAPDRPPDSETEEPAQEEAERVRPVAAPADDGVPVARYPEYDHATGRERPDWTTIREYRPADGPPARVRELVEQRHDVVDRLERLIAAARVSRPERRRRQPEGEALDLDAAIEAMVARRAGDTPDSRVYQTTERRSRDLAVSVLVDISESTGDRVRGATVSVLDLERAATALLAQAMAELGDPFAIAAFSSNRRDDVRYVRVKDFDEPFGTTVHARLAGLSHGYSTRIGAAMRHSARMLAHQPTHRKLLLVVTDGEPSDVDITDRTYLVEDARRAVQSFAAMGIDVFCVGLDSGGDSYLTRIFGRRNVVQIDRVERLPEALPLIYLRLTT